MMTLILKSGSISHAQLLSPSSTPPPDANTGLITTDTQHLIDIKTKAAQENATFRILDQQNSNQIAGNQNNFNVQTDIAIGKARAEQMVNLLQNAELQQAFTKVNAKGKEALQENPELKNPAAVIAGATSLWIGRTVQLIKDESFKLTTHVEGRSRSGDFSVESPLVNGKLKFQSNNGVNLNINRTISSIQSNAEVNYDVRSQTVSTQLKHRIAPNLDLSFGASESPLQNQIDERATIQYNISF